MPNRTTSLSRGTRLLSPSSSHSSCCVGRGLYTTAMFTMSASSSRRENRSPVPYSRIMTTVDAALYRTLHDVRWGPVSVMVAVWVAEKT